MDQIEIAWVDLHIKERIGAATYPLRINQWDIVQLGAEMTSMIKCIRRQGLNETSNYFFLFMIIMLRSSFMVYGRLFCCTCLFLLCRKWPKSFRGGVMYLRCLQSRALGSHLQIREAAVFVWKVTCFRYILVSFDLFHL